MEGDGEVGTLQVRWLGPHRQPKVTVEQHQKEQERKRRQVRSTTLDEDLLTFRAYDCNAPINLTSLMVRPNIECSLPNKIFLDGSQKFALIQKTSRTKISVKSCRLTRNRIAYHCGGSGHSAVAPLEFQYDYNTPVAITDCRRYWQDQQIKFHETPGHDKYHMGKWMEPHRPSQPEIVATPRNTTVRFYHETSGATWSDGWDIRCSGGRFFFQEYSRKPMSRVAGSSDDIVVVDHYKYEMYEEAAYLNTDGSILIHQSQLILPCTVDKEGCFVQDKGTYFWDRPSSEDTCPYYLTRDVEGVEIEGPDGERIFVAKDGAMIRLEKGSPISRCGGILFRTEFSNLYLADHQVSLGTPAFRRPLDPSEVSMATYVNQQDSFLYHKLVNEVQDRLSRQREMDCQKEEEKKADEYARRAAEQHAIVDGETVHLGAGQFVTAAGEVWYHYRCRPRMVRARAVEGCYSALPVAMGTEEYQQYRKERELRGAGETPDASSELSGAEHIYVAPSNEFFLEPRTHRLLSVALPTACAHPFVPQYENHVGRWIAYDENNLYEAPSPAPLDRVKWDLEDNAKEKLNFETGGIYTAATLRQLAKYMQAPRASMGVAGKLADQMHQPLHVGTVAANSFFPEVPVPTTFQAMNYLRSLWKLLEKYGQVCSILVGTALICRFLTWVVGVVLRLSTIPLTGSIVLHVLGALCPSFHIFMRDPGGCCARFFGAKRPQETGDGPEGAVAYHVVTVGGKQYERVVASAPTGEATGGGSPTNDASTGTYDPRDKNVPNIYPKHYGK